MTAKSHLTPTHLVSLRTPSSTHILGPEKLIVAQEANRIPRLISETNILCKRGAGSNTVKDSVKEYSFFGYVLFAQGSLSRSLQNARQMNVYLSIRKFLTLSC
jgi:hypothetical protein